MTQFMPYPSEWDPRAEPMASKHLLILRQGAAEWNGWRQSNPYVVPFLAGLGGVSDTDLSGVDLSGAMIWQTQISGVNLRKANLSWVSSWSSLLNNSDLEGAVVEDARLRFVSLQSVNLAGAMIARADLIGQFTDVDFSGCRLAAATLCGEFERVRFTGADLSNARFVNSRLSRVEFQGAALNQTSFVNTELRGCYGLEQVLHLGPSEFSVNTMLSSPEVPRRFWEAAGVASSIVDAVLGARQSVQYYPCFISYAGADSLLADELYELLRSNGVGCWKADRSLVIGDPQRDAIFKAIKDHDRFLVIISRHSVASGWVEQEVERALGTERDTGTKRILPIRADDAAMNSEMAWVVTLRDGRHVGDFSPWNNSSERERLKRELLLALERSGPRI